MSSLSPPQRGQVRLAKQPFYRDSTIINKRHPKIAGFTNIRVCSDDRRGRELSPMLIGPVINETEEQDENGLVLPNAMRFENFWQGLKVHTHELNESGNPNSIYLTRRKKNFMDKKGHRRVYPKKKLIDLKSKVEFTFYNKRKYTYLEARKEIYCTKYAEMIRENKYFKELEERLATGENLLIIGFDGFELDPLKADDVKFHINDPNKPVGHEFVICCLLHGIEPWKTE